MPYAEAAGVVLALEPLHPMVCAFRSVLCTTAQANDWCDALGGVPDVGIAVDTYNVLWDPDLQNSCWRPATCAPIVACQGAASLICGDSDSWYKPLDTVVIKKSKSSLRIGGRKILTNWLR